MARPQVDGCASRYGGVSVSSGVYLTGAGTAAWGVYGVLTAPRLK